MARLVKYVPNPAFVPAMSRSPQLSVAMSQAAQRGLRWAQAHAPRDTGTYAQSFRVEPAVVTVHGKPANGARLVNDATRTRGSAPYGYAFAVEYGRGAKHVLQRAVDAIEKG